MGAKVSKEMQHARRLVEQKGLTPYAAANIAGITKQAIYAAKWYKDRKNALSRATS